MSATQEKTFYEYGEVKVTNARFVVPSQTYAMSGITSVRFFTEKPNLLWPTAAFLLALIAWAANGTIWHVAVPLLIGVLLISLRKATHHVILSSASGETRALNSKNKEFIANVIKALNQAIVSRG